MVEPSRISFRDGRLASRKAEEAALRRFEAATWLEKMAGPLDLPSRPTEQEFVSCLKSGLVLCNAINKIQPGAVPKVIANQSFGLAWENQTLPAYQYFENIRNFLVVVNELKIPSFEASDIERDTMEAGSVGKIVDCILGLKAYHEWKQSNKGIGLWKYSKSPMMSHSKARMQSNIPASASSVRCLDMSTTFEKLQPLKLDDLRTEGKVDSLVKAIADSMFSSKENIDKNIFDLWNEGMADPLKLFDRIISNCLQNQELKSVEGSFVERNTITDVSTPNSICKLKSVEGSFVEGNTITDVSTPNSICKCCSFCLGKASCNHRKLLDSQETEVEEIKALLSKTKLECAALQSQVQNDLRQIGCQIQGLSAAALGYHRAVEENRSLHNMIQELRGNIQVFCRVRPAFCSEVKCSIDYIGNDGTLIILDPLKSQLRKIFQFNKVFGSNVTQEGFYKETQSLIRSVMDGYNVCIFAYGQTGSGKTYSMCGPSIGPGKDIGINSKALNDLFQISCTREDINYEIHVQMVEIYNEQVRDLLSEEGSTTKLEIRNCSSNGGLSLPDATMHRVLSTSDVVNLMKVGEKNRAFSCTAMNNRSSRSHSVLTIHVCGRDVLGSKLQSCLHLIDLAGSERVDRTEVTGDRMKEAQYINKSLSCLGDVIAALAQKSSHVPYRNSKLTQLLQNSLGGHAKMLMLAHVSPEAESYGETISTLKFAQRVSSVELGAAHVNKESIEIRDLREQIDSLKKELASREHLKGSYLHKMKENNPPLERDNGTDDRKLPIKSPLPRPKFSTGQSVSRFRRLSLEGSGHEKNQQKTKILESDQNLQIAAEQLKHVDHEELKADAAIESFSQTNGIERLPSSTSISSSSSLSQLTAGNRCGQLGEFATPDANKIKLKSSSTFSSSKGSQHIRKSLQTIGKLINGSEKRNSQVPSVMPAPKLNIELHAAKKSPATVESRYRRRQSLNNVQAIEMKGSRRSSLGGKSVESYPAFGIAVPRTPPAVPASTKSAKAWF